MVSTKDLEPMTAHISEDGLQREETVAEHTENTRFLCDKKGKRCGMSQRVSGYLLYRTKAAPSLAESPVYSYISIQYNDFFYKAMHQGIKPITVPSFNNTR